MIRKSSQPFVILNVNTHDRLLELVNASKAMRDRWAVNGVPALAEHFKGKGYSAHRRWLNALEAVAPRKVKR